jgi:hypothetical protein
MELTHRRHNAQFFRSDYMRWLRILILFMNDVKFYLLLKHFLLDSSFLITSAAHFFIALNIMHHEI